MTRTLALAAALAAAGCSAGPARGPVTGTVTYKGMPVGAAAVDFYPADGGPVAGATTLPDGTFALDTPGHGAGAAAGLYKVTVAALNPADGRRLPAKCGDPAATPLAADVPPGGAAGLAIELRD
jgi:hypothetical protein